MLQVTGSNLSGSHGNPLEYRLEHVSMFPMDHEGEITNVAFFTHKQ